LLKKFSATSLRAIHASLAIEDRLAAFIRAERIKQYPQGTDILGNAPQYMFSICHANTHKEFSESFDLTKSKLMNIGGFEKFTLLLIINILLLFVVQLSRLGHMLSVSIWKWICHSKWLLARLTFCLLLGGIR
jgi:hypothetical protein